MCLHPYFPLHTFKQLFGVIMALYSICAHGDWWIRLFEVREFIFVCVEVRGACCIAAHTHYSHPIKGLGEDRKWERERERTNEWEIEWGRVLKGNEFPWDHKSCALIIATVTSSACHGFHQQSTGGGRHLHTFIHCYENMMRFISSKEPERVKCLWVFLQVCWIMFIYITALLNFYILIGQKEWISFL